MVSLRTSLDKFAAPGLCRNTRRRYSCPDGCPALLDAPSIAVSLPSALVMQEHFLFHLGAEVSTGEEILVVLRATCLSWWD